VPVYLMLHSDEEIDVTYLRDGEKIETTLVPQENPESGRSLIGIYYEPNNEKLGPLQTLQYSFYEVEYQIWTVLSSIRMLIQGKFSFNDLSGPVGIVKVVGDTYNESMQNGGIGEALLNMLNMIVLLSANLCVMNLLPIPGLDGGRLLFILIEAITRKRIPPEKEGMIHVIGVVILLGLMAVILFNDIRKIVTGGL
jgi:regulator of sigma E protease